MTDELTPGDVRAWADTVEAGECITFPNGLVIDKRTLLTAALGLPRTPSPASTATPIGQYRCPSCNGLFSFGVTHACDWSKL